MPRGPAIRMYFIGMDDRLCKGGIKSIGRSRGASETRGDTLETKIQITMD
jgi:hypothetical protein